MKNNVIKRILFFILLFVLFLSLSLIIFQKSFSVFFFQDDFFLFSISRISTWSDLVKIFIPRTDVIYYRPISLQLFYYLFHLLFKFNILYYHIFQFFLYSVNGILVFILVKIITKKKILAFLSSVLFVISWTHIYELTWAASTFNSIGLFFCLSYFIFYLSYIRKITFLSEVSLIFALLSIEIAVVIPFLLVLTLLFIFKIEKKDYPRIIVHFLFCGIYILFRFIIFKIPTTGSYQIELSIQTLKNVAIFILWLFNFPEASIIHLKPNFYLLTATDSWFAERFQGLSIILTISLLFYIFYFVSSILSAKKKTLKISFFCLLWFIISLVPFIIIPKRAYPYYLLIAQIGFWIFFSHILLSSKFKLLSVICLLLYLSTNLLNVTFNANNHWLYMTSSHAENYYQKYSKMHEVLKNKKSIFWQIDDMLAQNAVTNGLAFNVFGNNYEQKYFLKRNDIPKNLRLTTFDLYFYLAKQRTKRLAKFYELKIATPSAAMDLWY